MPQHSLQTYLGPGLTFCVPFGDLCLLDIALNIQVPLTLLSQHIVLNLIPRLTLLVRKYGMVEISNIGMLHAPLHCRNVLHLSAVQIYVYLNSNCVLTYWPMPAVLFNTNTLLCLQILSNCQLLIRKWGWFWDTQRDHDVDVVVDSSLGWVQYCMFFNIEWFGRILGWGYAA